MPVSFDGGRPVFSSIHSLSMSIGTGIVIGLGDTEISAILLLTLKNV